MKGYATLYPANATEEMLNSNGLGVLSDCISGTVTRERNGEYEIEFEYPIDGAHFSDIALGCLVKAEPEKDHSEQLFEIYAISKPKNGKCTINGEHVSYRLNRVTVEPFEATGASSALAGLVTHSIGENPFTTWTDIENSTTKYTQTEPATFRSQLGGEEGSILDLFGGEYDFDNYTVKLYKAMGTDRGVTIEYGKNLIDLKQEETIQDTITGIVPYWIDNEGKNLVMLLEKVIECENAGNFPYKRTVPHDFSQDFQDKPTEEQLRSKAQAYVKANITGTPDVSITVSAQNLADTEEYKNLSQEIIRLCDTVTVKFLKLGVNATAKVVSIEYDFVNRKINEFTIGSIRSNLAQTIVNSDKQAQESIDKSASSLQQALNDAKTMLMGGYGGHVVPSYNADKQMNAIYVIDTTDPATAVKGLAINMNGIGGFTDGISGDVNVAITIDGQIVADAITTGTLRAIDIEGVNITGSNITGTNITGTTISGSSITFGSTYPVTMTSNSDGDGVSISGTGEVDIESNRTLLLKNYFSTGERATVITLDTTNRYVQDAYFRIANYSKDYTEDQHEGALTGSRAFYQTEINGTYTENRLWNLFHKTQRDYADAQIASVTQLKDGKPYAATMMYVFAYENGEAIGQSWINMTTEDGGVFNMSAFSGNIEIQAWDGRVNIRQDINGSLIDGTVVQGRDSHIYTLQWDGSHCYLWVDVTRVGQII